jgi:hypothetical protein
MIHLTSAVAAYQQTQAAYDHNIPETKMLPQHSGNNPLRMPPNDLDTKEKCNTLLLRAWLWQPQCQRRKCSCVSKLQPQKQVASCKAS